MIALLCILLGAVGVMGVVNRFGSLMAGRRGVRFLQPIYTIVALFGRGSVRSAQSSVVSEWGPVVSLAALVTAALMIPLGSFGAVLSFEGDAVAFCLLLVLSRVALWLVAMDAAGAFQGMGTARELLLSMLGEPALFLLFGTLCLLTGSTSMSGVFGALNNVSIDLVVLTIVVGYGFFQLLTVECGRVPVDDPATHLELTMLHEAMVLDVGAFDLALIKIGGLLKLSIFTILVANALIPAYVGGWVLVAAYLGVAVAVGAVVGVGESLRARNRMNKNATYVAMISAVGILAFIIGYLLTHTSIS